MDASTAASSLWLKATQSRCWAQCMLGLLTTHWTVVFKGLEHMAEVLTFCLLLSAGRFWAGKNGDLPEKVAHRQRDQVLVLLPPADARQHQPCLQQRVRDIQVTCSAQLVNEEPALHCSCASASGLENSLSLNGPCIIPSSRILTTLWLWRIHNLILAKLGRIVDMCVPQRFTRPHRPIAKSPWVSNATIVNTRLAPESKQRQIK